MVNKDKVKREEISSGTNRGRFTISNELDSGYGWFIVLASFLMQACSFGVVSGYGVYLEHYRSNTFRGKDSHLIAMIGTVSSSTIALASFFIGRSCDLFGVRLCAILGTVFIVTSHIAASFSDKIWQFILFQGFMFGLGGALIYVPSSIIITQWFQKRRGLAVGIGAAGSGAGGLIFSVVNSFVLPSLGHANTLRLNGLIIGICLLISIIIIRPRVRKLDNSESGSDSEVFKVKSILNLRFGMFLLCMLSASFSFLTPLYYLPSYAVHHGLTSKQGASLVAIISSSSAVGRIFFGLLGDKWGHVNIFLFSLVSCALLPLIWMFATTYPLLICFAILYGAPTGGFAGGFPSVCAALFGEAHLATLMGIAYAPTGLGDLIGPVFSGFILDHTHDYHYIIIYVISLFGLSALLVAILHFAKCLAPPCSSFKIKRVVNITTTPITNPSNSLTISP